MLRVLALLLVVLCASRGHAADCAGGPVRSLRVTPGRVAFTGTVTRAGLTHSAAVADGLSLVLEDPDDGAVVSSVAIPAGRFVSRERSTKIDSAQRCDFLIDERCVLPFPSSAFLDDDPSTPTGTRVHYPPTALPRNTSGQHIDPADWELRDLPRGHDRNHEPIGLAPRLGRTAPRTRCSRRPSSAEIRPASRCTRRAGRARALRLPPPAPHRCGPWWLAGPSARAHPTACWDRSPWHVGTRPRPAPIPTRRWR